MKIVCPRATLVSAVSNVSRAVGVKTTIPALEGILLDAKEDCLQLTGYDLELGITTRLDAQVLQPGRVVLSAKLLVDMVRKMPGDTIEIACDDRLMTTVVSGASEFHILGISPEDYPDLPAPGEEDRLEMENLLLQSMIDQTLFAVAVSDAKPVHTGSLFELQDGVLTVVSVDGFRLAIRREKVQSGQDLRFIVPGKTLSEVSKLIGGEEETVAVSLSQKHAVFEIGNYRVTTRLLEGDFLDYRGAVPKSHSTQAEVSVRELTDSVERASLLISDRLKSPLKIRFEQEGMAVSCETSMGRVSDLVPCALEGNPVTMGFNNKYLLDALRNSGCDQVKLQISGPLSPMKVVPMEGESFLFLVLPVRLKNE